MAYPTAFRVDFITLPTAVEWTAAVFDDEWPADPSPLADANYDQLARAEIFLGRMLERGRIVARATCLYFTPPIPEIPWSGLERGYIRDVPPSWWTPGVYGVDWDASTLGWRDSGEAGAWPHRWWITLSVERLFAMKKQVLEQDELLKNDREGESPKSPSDFAAAGVNFADLLRLGQAAFRDAPTTPANDPRPPDPASNQKELQTLREEEWRDIWNQIDELYANRQIMNLDDLAQEMLSRVQASNHISAGSECAPRQPNSTIKRYASAWFRVLENDEREYPGTPRTVMELARRP